MLKAVLAFTLSSLIFFNTSSSSSASFIKSTASLIFIAICFVVAREIWLAVFSIKEKGDLNVNYEDREVDEEVSTLAKALEPLYLSSGEGSWRHFYDKGLQNGPRFFPKNPTGSEIENIEKLKKTLATTLATSKISIENLIPQLIKATEAFAGTFKFDISDKNDRKAVDKNGPIVKSLAEHLTSVQNGEDLNGPDLKWLRPTNVDYRKTTKQIAICFLKLFLV